MHIRLLLILTILAQAILPGRAQTEMENLFAWCIVPYDNQERTPAERIAMLKELGFTRYAYDWRARHLPEMTGEWRLAQEQGIEVMAVWLWIDATQDRPGHLSEANEQVLEAIRETGLETQIWLGFHNNYFEGLSEKKAVNKGMKMVRYLAGRAVAMNCRVALYNHGGWFGEPANQVRIIEKIPEFEVGIIFNFHHAHEQLDRFPEIVATMKPHLWAVNLNGMRRGGPKILPIGQGDQEARMLAVLERAGYTGPYGILGHVEEADVREILLRNLQGYRELEDR